MKHKQSFQYFLALLILAMILSACGGKPAVTATAVTGGQEATPTQAPAGGKVTLKILHNWGPSDSKGPPLQAIFDDFMKENPDIKIETDIAADFDIPTKVETAYLAGQEPDLVLSNLFSQTYKWADKGIIVPVDQYIKDWGLEGKFREIAISTWTINGKVVGFPLEGYVWPFWYNTKIFKELNLPLPKTWDEIIADTPQIKAAGYEVVSAGANDDSGFYTFETFLISSMKPEEYAKYKMEGNLASYPNAVKAVEQFVKVRDAGVFPKDAAGLQGEAVNNLFYSGKAAIWQGGSWFFGECPEAMRPDVVIGGVPLTNPTVWDKNWVLSGFDAKAVWITRNGAKQIDAVKKLIQFLYKPENIARFVITAGMPPPLKDVPIEESKLNSVFVQSLKWGDSLHYVSFPPSAPGVDTSQIGKDLWLPTTTAEQIVQGIDQAYKEGLGK